MSGDVSSFGSYTKNPIARFLNCSSPLPALMKRNEFDVVKEPLKRVLWFTGHCLLYSRKPQP